MSVDAHDNRLRLRALGHSVGRTRVGPTNSIVDVHSVRVGHTTLTDNAETFSGVTAIVVDGASPASPRRAGLFVGNGYGKLVGSTQVAELGFIETPIALTSTLSAFRAADAVVTWVLRESGADTPSINPMVGEVNDSWLSGPERRPVTAQHVLAAIDGATSRPVQMGNVGGGTGACALGFKGGIGSSSRILDLDGGPVTLGVLVQTNMDGELRALGRTIRPTDCGLPVSGPPGADGSCVVVVGVDAPFESNMLRRVAARAVFALARVGARFSHGSGDYALAFSSTGAEQPLTLTDAEASLAFEAAMDAVEEAVLDSLLAAETVRTSSGRCAFALPTKMISRREPR